MKLDLEFPQPITPPKPEAPGKAAVPHPSEFGDSTFFLSPVGCDDHSGTAGKLRAGSLEGPWRTPAGAVENVRRLRREQGLRAPVQLIFGAGTYSMRETLQLGSEDSYLTFAAAPGAKVFLDGGQPLTSFQETVHGGQRAWVLEIEEVRSQDWFFRQLWVDGVRRPRARLPKFQPDRDGATKTFQIEKIRLLENKGLFKGDSTFLPKAGDFKSWKSLPDAEAVVLHYWAEDRLPGPHLNPDTGWLHFGRRSVFNLFGSYHGGLANYYWDNLAEALTDPGEWYLDRSSGRLIYLPLPDENLEDTRVVAPRLTRLIEVSGESFDRSDAQQDPLSFSPAEEIEFHGLTFQHADWFQPQGFLLRHNRLPEPVLPLAGSPQGAIHVPAVIHFDFARRCRVLDCTIQHVGFYGLEIGAGCEGIEVSGCKFQDLGAGGIKIHGSDLDGAPLGRTRKVRITDNLITRIGRVFHQGVGILVGHAYDCIIAHNHIHDTLYTGISVGWVWGYRRHITRNILIENNRLHDIGQGVLSDMGAIYLLGVQPGTIVRGNWIHNVYSRHYGGWGLYFDEGASHIIAEHNLVHNVGDTPIHIHYGRENVIRNNILAESDKAIISIGRVESHPAATFLRNLFVGPAPLLITGGYNGDIRQQSMVSDLNLLCFPDGVPPVDLANARDEETPLLSFSQWQTLGFDTHSIVMPDPGFTDPGNHNYRLRSNAPALAYGFDQRDWLMSTGVRKKSDR